MQLTKESLKNLVLELIYNPPISTKKYLGQYSRETADPEFKARKIGVLSGYVLYQWQLEGERDFRVLLVEPKSKKTFGGMLFKARNKGGYEIGMASMDEKLRGSGLATKLIIKTLKANPEVPWWSSGVLVTEKGLQMFRRLFETGEVDMWFSLSPKDKAKKVTEPPEEFWSPVKRPRRPSDGLDDPKYRKALNQAYAVSAYGAGRKELYFRLK